MSGENEPSSPISPSSLKQKLKAASLRLPWLRNPHHEHHLALSPSTTPLPSPKPSPRANTHNNNKPSLTRSFTWRNRSPEFKDKCRNLINRIGHGNGHGHSPGHRHSHSHGHGHGRRHSTDFRYDPSSYALNFDEGCDDSQLDEFPIRNFTARLPRSPTTATTREVTTFT
ncbi:hypothetical protein PTKIN_Ptkin03bG0152400 [Pterospermum kingtungense]